MNQMKQIELVRGNAGFIADGYAVVAAGGGYCP